MELPEDLTFNEAKASPRVVQVGGKCYSTTYIEERGSLPGKVRDLIYSFRSIAESYFACDVNVNKPNFWRNLHVPHEISQLEQEVYADAFHQDLVVDQYNIQLFILLHDTDEEHGPFEYLDKKTQANEMNHYRKRNRKAPLSNAVKLVGKRGDYLFITTGSTLHRDTIPKEGFQRDIFSVAFFPSYANMGTPIAELVRNLEKI